MKGRILDYLSIEAARELRTKKVVYIDNMDAALSLIDRKLENAYYVEGVRLNNNTDLWLIQAGSTDIVRGGQLIAIFLVRKKKNQGQALTRGEVRLDLNIGHYTLVSDIHCAKDEVNMYEILQAYRNKSTLLRNDQRMLL